MRPGLQLPSGQPKAKLDEDKNSRKDETTNRVD